MSGLKVRKVPVPHFTEAEACGEVEAFAGYNYTPFSIHTAFHAM